MSTYGFALRNLPVLLGVMLGLAPLPALAADPPPNVEGPIPHLPWIHEGLVINGTWTASTFRGHAMDFVEDENGRLQLAGGGDAAARPGTSASGVTAATITCIDGNKVCIFSNSYADMRLLGCKDPVSQHMPLSFIVNAQQCDYWIDPVRLAEMHSDVENHKLVATVQWKAGDRAIDAIRVTIVREHSYSDRFFDRKTGICLHYCEISNNASREGGALITTGGFLATRDAFTPWAAEPIPAWARQFKALHYRGTTAAVASAVAGPPTPIGMDLAPAESGNGWVSVMYTRYALVQGKPAFPSKAQFVCGRNQYGCFFAGPAALAKLHAGQVLDEDPVTRMRTVATEVDDHSVTITSSNAGGKVSHTYDRNSGKLLKFERYDAMTHIQTTMQLQGEE